MYDIIIIGSGPAGLSAGIYGARANKKVLILEKSFFGGQMTNIFNIENYPGFDKINGFDLALKMRNQVEQLGVKILNEEVVSVDLLNNVKCVTTHSNTYTANAVVIATGAYAKFLDVKNEKEFLGKGLSYCATCDGNFFKDKNVAVVGGGNSSFDDCLYLSNIAKKIYLIHRRDVFTGSSVSFEAIKNLEKIGKVEILTDSVVTCLSGNQFLEKIDVLNKKQNTNLSLDVSGIFVAIGRKPDTEIFSKQINLTKDGFIETNANMETNIENVYAVGDVRNSPLRQIVTACSDGAVAVMNFVAKNATGGRK